MADLGTVTSSVDPSGEQPWHPRFSGVLGVHADDLRPTALHGGDIPVVQRVYLGGGGGDTMFILAGSTNRLPQVFAQNVLNGFPYTALAYNTAGLSVDYQRESASGITPVSLVSATQGTWTSGGWVAVGAGMPGVYEIGVPNAALPDAAHPLTLLHIEHPAIIPILLRLELVVSDNSAGVNTLLSRIPAAAALASGATLALAVPEALPIPETGTVVVRVSLTISNQLGTMTNADAAPTLTLTNAAGTSRAARLDSTTMTSVSTGVYRVDYTASASDAEEGLVWTFNATVGGIAQVRRAASVVTAGGGGSDFLLT